MAIRLLYGKQRNELRAACLAEVCDLTRRWPDKRAILLVPEQTKMDMEQDYLRQSGQSGLMMAEVLSFRRLAWRLLGEVGRQPLKPVDRVGQSMLIHQVLKEHQDSLHTFGFLADKPGFIRQVAAVIGDLKRYGISGSQLLHLDIEQADIGLKNKASDLGILLEHYDSTLASTGLGDAEDDLNRLAEVLATLAGLTAEPWPWPWQRLAWLRQTDIWVSGFGELRDFTPQEDAVLAGLAALAENLTISVAADYVPADRQAVDAGADPFMPGRRTAYRLRTALPTARLVRIGQDLPDQHGQHMPGQAIDAFDPDRLALKLVLADGLDDELAWVAGEIRQLVQVDGFRYRDITLALCDPGGYAPRLRAVCREYGIPIFLDQEKPLSGTPLLRFIIGLLDMELTGWSRNALMSCLRSGMTGLTAAQIDRLENEWLARGLFRLHRLFDDRLYQDRVPAAERMDAGEAADERGLDDSATTARPVSAATPRPVSQSVYSSIADNDESMLDLRDRALLPLQRFLSSEEVRKAAPARDKCQALRRFLVTAGLNDRILTMRDGLVADGEMDAAVTLVQSWNELDRLLDQMEHLAGDMPYTLQTFRDVLAAGMDSAASSIIPTAIDQVGVGDLRRAILRQPRVLFIIGASAANLPPQPPPEGLLKDQDRQVLSRLLARQLPSVARDQLYADSFVLYTLLTLPTERLCLTTPDTAQSATFRWLANQVPSSVLVLPQTPDWRDARLNAVKPARNRLQSLGREWSTIAAPDTQAWLALVDILSGQPILPPADRASLFDPSPIADQISAGCPPADCSLGDSLTRDLYGQPVVLSVSRLERYALCPFQHLSDHLLRLQDRPVWAPQTAETGIVLHGIMELAIERLRQEMLAISPANTANTAALRSLWQTWLQRDLEVPVRAWMDAVIKRDGLERFLDHGLQASVGRRIRKTALSSIRAVLNQYQDQGSDADQPFLPADLEWVFGVAGQLLAVPVADGSLVHLRGKVDRIDERIAAEGRQFRIIDYKSGNKRVDFADLYQGLALQMPIYLAAYRQANPGVLAADAAYLHLHHPIASLSAGETTDPAAIQAKLMKAQDLHGMNLSSDDLTRVCDHALRQAARLAADMLRGAFPASPCKKPGGRPACDFCTYQALCGFDPRNNAYRRPKTLRGRKNPDGKTLSKKDELILRLREQAGNGTDKREG